jgi:hypothetical protein
MTAGDLERTKALVLDYHRMMPSEPRFAACLIGRSLIESIDDLDAAYDELVKAGQLEAAGTAQAIDKKTGEKFGSRSLFRCREGIRGSLHEANH